MSAKIYTVYLTSDDIAKLQNMINEALEVLKEDAGSVISSISREAIETAELELEGIKEELQTAKNEGRTA